MIFRDVFRLAKENSPAIIFIDEIDAIATKRFDAQTGADREVQRILLELLNQGRSKDFLASFAMYKTMIALYCRGDRFSLRKIAVATSL